MRLFAFILAAMALGACGQQQQSSTAPSSGCAHQAVQAITWSDANAQDSISTRSEGPSCSQAVVLLVARNANGDPLWTFASAYYDLTSGGIPPEDAPEATDEQVQAFLADWANVTVTTSDTLPEWREGVATLTESASTFAYDTPFDRETYEAMRGRNLRMICYAAAAEATQCLVIDPASNAPTMIVAYGP